ncbi:MAG: DUF4838 domain-containing protein [Verrucomicrobia bacterium]|nr:DUF4838 domain-containing protein [Verrucomicrobiota bacterium]
MKKNRTLTMVLSRSLAGVLLFAGCGALGLDAVRTPLAQDGRALMPVIVGEQATVRVRQAAAELQAYLQRMSGASFELSVGDGTTGIAVGTAGDFASLPFGDALKVQGMVDRERYLLRSHAQGVYLIGATEQGVEHAVWDFLYRIGYRQFFPGATWEIAPEMRTINVHLDVVEKPDYHNRSIRYGWGMWDYNKQPYADWCRRNRSVKGFALSHGHMYQAVVSANKAVFDAHPEYYALVKGKRSSDKMCLSNPEVRKLVVEYDLKTLASAPAQECVSVEPSDGDGWCECAACAAMGSISDRAVTLANEVAQAVAKNFPGKRVGMYAYNQHSPPPTITMEKNIVVSIATAFITGGYTVEQLFERWGKMGGTLGVREYYGLIVGDRDLPGKAVGSNIDYLRRSIPRFHRQGARFMDAEASDNWGCSGLGYYLASRMLWDITEAERIEALKEDFIEKCFGPAAAPMRDFYKLIDGGNKPLFGEDLIGRMYRLLGDARGRAGAPDILARLQALVLYTRYAELYFYYTNPDAIPETEQTHYAAFDQGGEKPRATRSLAAEALVRHVYRIRQTMMIHALGFLRESRMIDKESRPPAEVDWKIPEGKNPWRSSEPFTEGEIKTILANGIANHKLREFEPATFGSDLKPADGLRGNLNEKEGGGPQFYFRGGRDVLTWFDKAPAEMMLSVTGGGIVGYRSRGNAQFSLRSGDGQTVFDQAEVPPDGNPHTVVLKTPQTGLHTIRMHDLHVGTTVRFPANLPVVFACAAPDGVTFNESVNAAFYVPIGARTIGGCYSGGGDAGCGHICHPDGNIAERLKKAAAFKDFNIPVPKGEDGKVWTVRQARGSFLLMTVPPYLALGNTPMLLPKEVVSEIESNSQKHDKK